MKDMKEEVAKPRKVALYMYMASSGDPWYSVYEVTFNRYDEHYDLLPEGQEREDTRQGFTRVSDITEVAFAPLSSDAVVQQAVASLDEEERKTMAELNQRIAEIRGRKAQLLALTYQPETVDG